MYSSIHPCEHWLRDFDHNRKLIASPQGSWAWDKSCVTLYLHGQCGLPLNRCEGLRSSINCLTNAGRSSRTPASCGRFIDRCSTAAVVRCCNYTDDLHTHRLSMVIRSYRAFTGFFIDEYCSGCESSSRHRSNFSWDPRSKSQGLYLEYGIGWGSPATTKLSPSSMVCIPGVHVHSVGTYWGGFP